MNNKAAESGNTRLQLTKWREKRNHLTKTISYNYSQIKYLYLYLYYELHHEGFIDTFL